MPIYEPRIPKLYSAIDSAAFTLSAGPAFGALLLDAIEGAHNRLQSAAAHGFALAVPMTTVLYGDVQEPLYRQPIGPFWQPVVPAFTWATKPSARTASFRAEFELNITEPVQFQVATRQQPFSPLPDTSSPNYVEVTGTGSPQTASFDGVPISGGETESVALWARTTSRGNSIGTTYGSPVSGVVVDTDRVKVWCRHTTASTDVVWNTTADDRPLDFASKGYGAQFTGPDGGVTLVPISRVAMWPITTAGVGDQGVLDVVGLAPYLAGQMVSRFEEFTFEIREMPQLGLYGWSGATEARTR